MSLDSVSDRISWWSRGDCTTWAGGAGLRAVGICDGPDAVVAAHDRVDAAARWPLLAWCAVFPVTSSGAGRPVLTVTAGRAGRARDRLPVRATGAVHAVTSRRPGWPGDGLAGRAGRADDSLTVLTVAAVLAVTTGRALDRLPREPARAALTTLTLRPRNRVRHVHILRARRGRLHALLLGLLEQVPMLLVQAVHARLPVLHHSTQVIDLRHQPHRTTQDDDRGNQGQHPRHNGCPVPAFFSGVRRTLLVVKHPGHAPITLLKIAIPMDTTAPAAAMAKIGR